jgi:hypothetical protein
MDDIRSLIFFGLFIFRLLTMQPLGQVPAWISTNFILLILVITPRLGKILSAILFSAGEKARGVFVLLRFGAGILSDVGIGGGASQKFFDFPA